MEWKQVLLLSRFVFVLCEGGVVSIGRLTTFYVVLVQMEPLSYLTHVLVFVLVFKIQIMLQLSVNCIP